MFLFRIFVAILIIGFTGMPTLADDATLSKESQNPVGDIISLPIEYWHYDGIANGSARLFTGLSSVMKRLQTGYVQNYAVWMLVGIVFLIVYYLLW